MRRTRPSNSKLARYRGERGDGTERWEGRFSVRDPNRPGRRQWIQKAGFTTKTDAERWAKVAQAEYIAGKIPEDRRRTGVTFATAANEWLRYVEERGAKPSTLREYRSAVEHHLKPAFRGDLRDVTPAKVEAWLHSNPDLTSRTRSKLLTNLHGVFERARKAYGLATNPAADIERPRETNSGDLEVFSPDEVRRLFGCRHRPRCRDLPDRRVYRPAPRRVDRAPLARRRSRQRHHPRPRLLRRPHRDHPEVGQGPLGPDDSRGR